MACTGMGAPTTVVSGALKGSRPQSAKMPLPLNSGWLVPQCLQQQQQQQQQRHST
jgi:hypothetical protein